MSEASAHADAHDALQELHALEAVLLADLVELLEHLVLRLLGFAHRRKVPDESAGEMGAIRGARAPGKQRSEPGDALVVRRPAALLPRRFQVRLVREDLELSARQHEGQRTIAIGLLAFGSACRQMLDTRPHDL